MYHIREDLSPDRFDVGMHYVPERTEGMVELSFNIRFILFIKQYPDSPFALVNPYSVTPDNRTDINCALDNYRIPTHAEQSVDLSQYDTNKYLFDTSSLKSLYPEHIRYLGNRKGNL